MAAVRGRSVSGPSGVVGRHDDDAALNPIIVVGLASGMTYEQIGELANCSARTVRREAARSEVRAAVAAEQRRMASSAAARFTALLDQAITVVEGAFRDFDPGVRLRAADMTFRQFLRFGEHIDLRTQLEDLRAQLNARLTDGTSDTGERHD
jgi:hypothetical protein